MIEKRIKKEPLSARVSPSLKKDIEKTAKKEKVTASQVTEAWLLVGQKNYKVNK